MLTEEADLVARLRACPDRARTILSEAMIWTHCTYTDENMGPGYSLDDLISDLENGKRDGSDSISNVWGGSAVGGTVAILQRYGGQRYGRRSAEEYWKVTVYLTGGTQHSQTKVTTGLNAALALAQTEAVAAGWIIAAPGWRIPDPPEDLEGTV